MDHRTRELHGTCELRDDDMTISERPAGSDGLHLSQPVVEQLRAGDERAWRDFLVAYHGVFVKAVRVAAARWNRPLLLSVRDWPAGLVDDAKTCFFTCFTRSFRTYLGEGQFRSYLFKVVHFFMRDHLDGIPRQAPEAIEHDDRVSMAAWVETERRDADGREDVLRGCIDRLDSHYRCVVLLYCFGDAGQSLAAVAATIGLSVEAVGKRFQRAKALLTHCVKARIEDRHAIR